MKAGKKSSPSNREAAQSGPPANPYANVNRPVEDDSGSTEVVRLASKGGWGAILLWIFAAAAIGAGIYVYVAYFRPEGQAPLSTVASDNDAAPQAMPTSAPQSSAMSAAPAVSMPMTSAAASNAPTASIASSEPAHDKFLDGTALPTNHGEAQKLLDAAAAAIAASDWPRATRLYQRVAKSQHMTVDGQVGLANVAFQTGDIDGAIVLAKKAKVAGAGWTAEIVLARAYYKKGQLADAAKSYQAVLGVHPDNKEAQAGLEASKKH
jgi:hypothetical protein